MNGDKLISYLEDMQNFSAKQSAILRDSGKDELADEYKGRFKLCADLLMAIDREEFE